MNATELARGVDWMTTRWGPQPAWKEWDRFWTDFAPFTPGALMQTLSEWYQAGEKFAPKPAELLKAVTETARRRHVSGADPMPELVCDSHSWAMPFPHEVVQERMCVRCGEVRPV